MQNIQTFIVYNSYFLYNQFFIILRKIIRNSTIFCNFYLTFEVLWFFLKVLNSQFVLLKFYNCKFYLFYR